MLKARLYEYEIQKKKKLIKEMTDKTDIGWGIKSDLMFYNLISWLKI